MGKRRPSGDGMVRKREDGRWEGRIVIGHKDNGEPIFRYVSAKTQKDLLKKLHQNIEEYWDVNLCEDSKMSLREWLDRWLEEYVAPSVRPPPWRDIEDTSNETSSHTWGISRWERLPQRTSGSCTGSSRPTGGRRNTLNMGTGWRAPPSAASMASCMKLWMRRCGKI